MPTGRHFYARKFDNEADAILCWQKARAQFNPGIGVGLVRMVDPFDRSHIVVLWYARDYLEGGVPWDVPKPLQDALMKRRLIKGVEAQLSGQPAYERQGESVFIDSEGRDVKVTEDN